jgi:hypothetical protein
VDYVDSTLVRLADPGTRSAVFDQEALERALRAAYDIEAMPIEGPYSPVFEEFKLGLAVPQPGNLEGSWNALGGGDRKEARFQLSGVGGERLRVEAFWRGAIVGRVRPGAGQIEDVSTNWPGTAGIDAEIVAALGALPADPGLLEQARRSRFLARIRAGLDQAVVFTDAMLDQWLARAGAGSVGELISRAAQTASGSVRVTFTAPSAGPPTPKPVSIAAAVLIRDVGFSLVELLAQSKSILTELESSGLGRPQDPSLRPRLPLIVIWVIPFAVFNDADWPGADPAARRLLAGQWLAREGIGLVATA